MGGVGLDVGLGVADSYSKRRSLMEMMENVLMMALLMALGAGITVVVLAGFIYWMEFQND